MGFTHLVFGILLYALFSNVFQVPFGTAYPLLAVTLGSLLPDIDHPSSLISKQAVFSIVSKAVRRVARHRGPTHSLLFTVLSTAVVAAVVLYYGEDLLISITFAIGYLSHLIADSLTRSGVRWLWPFHDGEASFVFHTGGLAEKAFFWGSLLGLAWIVQNLQMFG